MSTNSGKFPAFSKNSFQVGGGQIGKFTENTLRGLVVRFRRDHVVKSARPDRPAVSFDLRAPLFADLLEFLETLLACLAWPGIRHVLSASRKPKVISLIIEFVSINVVSFEFGPALESTELKAVSVASGPNATIVPLNKFHWAAWKLPSIRLAP
jgi:hypothetical protein